MPKIDSSAIELQRKDNEFEIYLETLGYITHRNGRILLILTKESNWFLWHSQTCFIEILYNHIWEVYGSIERAAELSKKYEEIYGSEVTLRHLGHENVTYYLD